MLALSLPARFAGVKWAGLTNESIAPRGDRGRHSEAVSRCLAHESRRGARWLRASREERAWINSLDDQELGQLARELTAVDRAVTRYRLYLEDEAA